MFHKSFTLGVAASLIVAPGVALADQAVQSNSVVNQVSNNNGLDNLSGQTSITENLQQQIKNGVCNSEHQMAIARTITSQLGENFGIKNVTAQASVTATTQQQTVAHKYFCQ